MQGLIDRDAAALAALYDRYAALVMAVCKRGLRDHAEAEQLTLDVFQELWDRADRFDPRRSKPRIYLLTVTRSRTIDRLRKRAASREVRGSGGRGSGAPELHEDRSAEQPWGGLVAAEDRARVHEALSALHDSERRAIELSFLEDLTHTQIAELTGTPLGTVKTRIRRGLLKLRGGLLRTPEGGDPR